ncbi:MAG: 3-methyladenine glycosylase [Candidatus Midichloriaceae bacterium]|jgi:DNA-3-methyladenine glycosylase|nr:3-methyladenine glycosylase [Candidatus Midichloriaceae bacterium]
MRLTKDFYNNCVVDVAKNLIGKRLIFGKHQGIITETEAYRGVDDEACHAFKGITNRTSIMFGPPGFAYVYLIYGMYHCLNIITEEEGKASGVLIRGLKLPEINLNGPGKLCRYLGITREHNGINVVESDDFYLTEGVSVKNILITPRIGIAKAIDKPWRFVADILS